jgi:tRNA threonylcarbamoyladenosine biosynthesis protein TsaB
MKILAVDTSGPVAGAALYEDGALTHEILANHGLTHSQTIMPMVDDALSAAGLRPKDVDLFAAVAGPGSFTGVRIGVGTVKALAHAVQKPCLGLDALEVLAMGASGFEGTVCPILDARRGQVYCAAFDAAQIGARPVRLLPDRAVALEEFLGTLPEKGRLLFLGDGLKVHMEAVRRALGDRALRAPAHMASIRPGAACALAALMESEKIDYMELQPIYLRASQAERERLAREERARNGGN